MSKEQWDMVECDHVSAGYTPVLPMEKACVQVGDLRVLVLVALCGSCSEQYYSHARVEVTPERMRADGIGGELPRMWIWKSAGLAPVPVRPIQRPIRGEWDDVVIAGRAVRLWAGDVGKDREMMKWSRAFAAGTLTGKAFREISAAIVNGPSLYGVVPVEMPAEDPDHGREQQTRPRGAPAKHSTKTRLRWGSRVEAE